MLTRKAIMRHERKSLRLSVWAHYTEKYPEHHDLVEVLVAAEMDARDAEHARIWSGLQEQCPCEKCEDARKEASK